MHWFIYKVSFRDMKTNVPRAIKIVARSACEATAKARELRGCHFCFAKPVGSDEEYAMTPIAVPF